MSRVCKKFSVFQQYNLVPILNVYENIVLPIELDGNAIDKPFLDHIVKTLGLADKLDKLPNQLSGGQQQRVAIARALATKGLYLARKIITDQSGYMKVTSELGKGSIFSIYLPI